MSCFIVPVVEAIAVKAVEKSAKSCKKTQLVRRLSWLSKMLWGGSALLAFEHVWHGEIIPVFPFLTATSNKSEMLHEMATTGTAMALLITAVWGVTVILSATIERRASEGTD